MNTIVIVYDPEQTEHRLDADDESGRLGDLEAYLRDHLDDKRVVAHINEIAGHNPEDIKSAAGHAKRVLAALQAGAPDLEHRSAAEVVRAQEVEHRLHRPDQAFAPVATRGALGRSVAEDRPVGVRAAVCHRAECKNSLRNDASSSSAARRLKTSF